MAGNPLLHPNLGTGLWTQRVMGNALDPKSGPIEYSLHNFSQNSCAFWTPTHFSRVKQVCIVHTQMLLWKGKKKFYCSQMLFFFLPHFLIGQAFNVFASQIHSQVIIETKTITHEWTKLKEAFIIFFKIWPILKWHPSTRLRCSL